MAEKTKDTYLFNILFSAMGLLLLAVATWVGASVSHIPSIETKMDDFITSATQTLGDHETRIRVLEKDQEK